MPGYALQRSPVLDSHDVPWPRLNSVVSGRHQELVHASLSHQHGEPL
jgi:hypothetical protein